MLHVMPVNDLREHEMATTCWCLPRVEWHEEALVIHNSADGRELTEPLRSVKMSYSVIQKCRQCAKESKCADGYVIRGAVQGIIHAMPMYTDDTPAVPTLHMGSGSVVHDCSNFEDKST
jgi:hypothetical protein